MSNPARLRQRTAQAACVRAAEARPGTENCSGLRGRSFETRQEYTSDTVRQRLHETPVQEDCGRPLPDQTRGILGDNSGSVFRLCVFFHPVSHDLLDQRHRQGLVEWELDRTFGVLVVRQFTLEPGNAV